MNITYDAIGTNYNLTRKADPFLTEKLIQHLSPTKKGIYLDIGCGTGNYTDTLQKKGYQFIGIDPSEKMLSKARMKNVNIDWRLGSAEDTQLPKNYIDGIIASLTIHHWTNLTHAFEELYRILKPAGTLVIFTSTPKQMKGYWLCHYFPKMLSDSMRQMPTLDAVKAAMNTAGLQYLGMDPYAVKSDLEDQFLYCGKHHPEFYFDDQIRHGISSFSALANREEVTQGLHQLKVDMMSGKINKIMRSFKNTHGDYLYILGKKPMNVKA